MAHLLYDEGDSSFWRSVKVLEVLFSAGVVVLVLGELMPGYSLAYSKFTNEFKGKITKVPSRIGMLIMYSPAALVAAWFLARQVLLTHESTPEDSNRGILKGRLVAAAIFVHFSKRDLETLFLHRYSGETGLLTAIVISSYYVVAAASLNVIQQKSESIIPPAIDCTWVGVLVFLIGVIGNFYCHLLLRGLRKEGEKKYVIPKGGLFDVFIAPHYLFESISFLGLALISQTFFAAILFTLVIMYLLTRTYSTKKWYLRKLDGFPKDRWVLIPQVF